MNYEGGYYLLNQPLIRNQINDHTTADPDAISQEVLDAVNLIQATPWRINEWCLDIMRQAYVEGGLHHALPSEADLPIPDRIDEKVWETMTFRERADRKYEVHKVRSHNNALISKREAFLRKLSVAESIRHHNEIYYPHYLDFRTRIYPIPQDLTPQGDDLAKSLLMFAQGLPLGDHGKFWLAVRLANCAGQDKLSLEDRYQWVMDHEALIIDCGERPLEGSRFWDNDEFDEPWGFLVTCREWVEMSKLRNHGDFISHLPVPQDGSCNGAQHLSLLGRDPVGAYATNCMDLEERQDLYSEVAKVVVSLVSADAGRGHENALNWNGHVTRKTVKRAVMTTPYGVTDRGIREQLVDDGFTSEIEGPQHANAAYLQEQISEALKTTLKKGKEIMGYFQETAKALAEADIPLVWITPTGSKVIQGYYKTRKIRPYTVLGRGMILQEDRDLGFSIRKQSLASAPNVIHSLDASHLVKSVLRMHRIYGVTNFAMIHDSYGTHACNTGALRVALRDAAAEMYQGNYLMDFHRSVQSYAPEVELPDLPDQGDWDPQEVRRSTYFFA